MTKLESRDDSTSEYNIDEEISAMFARLEASADQEAPVRTLLDALLFQREKDAKLKLQVAQSYLKFVREDTAKMRDILEEMATPHQAQKLSLGKDSPPGTALASTSTSVSSNTGRIQSGNRTHSLSSLDVERMVEDADEIERQFMEDKRREALEMDRMEVEELLARWRYEDEIERQWEEDYAYYNGDDRTNERYWEYQRVLKALKVDNEEKALWEAADMIAAEERRAEEEQEALIEQWQRERLEEQSLTEGMHIKLRNTFEFTGREPRTLPIREGREGQQRQIGVEERVARYIGEEQQEWYIPYRDAPNSAPSHNQNFYRHQAVVDHYKWCIAGLNIALLFVVVVLSFGDSPRDRVRTSI